MLKKSNMNWLNFNVITLLLIMFIDGVGMSLVLPLMGELFSGGQSSIVKSASEWTYQFYYAASLALFSGTMIIGCPLIGQFSDFIGRKKALQFSLVGTLLGYLTCVFAIIFKVPLLFLLGRTIDGITAGSIPVAQAMLVDIDKSSTKMTSIGMVMFAVTSGYILGPSISAIIFTHSLLTHMLYLPFLLIAILSALCIAMLFALNEDSPILQKTLKIDITVSLKQIKLLMLDKTLRSALLGFFLFQCAWTLYYQYIPVLQRYIPDLSTTRLSYLITEIGIGMCLSFCILVPKTQQFFSSKQLLLICIILFSVLSTTFIIIPGSWVQLQLASIAMSILYAIGYSAALACLLTLADESQKGLIFGSIASVCALSATLTALFGSALTTITYISFFASIFIASGIAIILFILSLKSSPQVVN